MGSQGCSNRRHLASLLCRWHISSGPAAVVGPTPSIPRAFLAFPPFFHHAVVNVPQSGRSNNLTFASPTLPSWEEATWAPEPSLLYDNSSASAETIFRFPWIVDPRSIHPH